MAGNGGDRLLQGHVPPFALLQEMPGANLVGVSTASVTTTGPQRSVSMRRRVALHQFGSCPGES